MSEQGILLAFRMAQRSFHQMPLRVVWDKYALAELHLRSGNPDRAAELFTLTQTLHRDLGGPARKAKFLELLARCRQ